MIFKVKELWGGGAGENESWTDKSSIYSDSKTEIAKVW